MENSVEEDITLIEKSLCDKDTIIQYHYWVGTDFLNAVERIVADYKRVLKENESLQKTYDDCYCKYKHYKQFESISVQKIKDKIEELKERKMDIVTSPIHNADEKIEILKKDKIRIQVLQELLESEE